MSAEVVQSVVPARTTAPTPAPCWSRSRTAWRPKIQGDPSMPFTDGTLCTKVAHYLERTYSPDRLLHPLRRVGQEGRRQVRAHQLGRGARRDRGAPEGGSPRTIPRPSCRAATPAPWAWCSTARWTGASSTASAPRCSTARCAPPPASSASRRRSAARSAWTRSASTRRSSIIIWGANPFVSNLHLWSRVQEAKRRGAKLVAIDPYRSLTAEKCTPAHRAAAGHRRRAGARHDARADRRGPDRSRLRRAATRSASKRSQKRVLANTRRERAARICGITRRGGGAARARLRHAPSPRRSASTTACSAMPAAASPRAPSPACPRWSAPGATRPAASCSPPRTSTSFDHARSSGRTCSPGASRACINQSRSATR